MERKNILQARLDKSGLKVETVSIGDEWSAFMKACDADWGPDSPRGLAEHCPEGVKSTKRLVSGSSTAVVEY